MASKALQIRDVPDESVNVMRARAAAEGMSLTAYLRRLVIEAASQPTLWLSAAALALALLVSWPLGIWLGTTGRGGSVTVVVSNVTRAVPTMALLSLIPLTALGFGPQSVIPALALFAVPPLLATAYNGMREVDADARDAAHGMGFSRSGMLVKVELPLAVPQLASGFRTAAVQVVATTTLAALFNGGGLGEIIAGGFGLGLAKGGGEILAGGILVAGLSLIVEGLLALGEKYVTPKALRELSRTKTRVPLSV